MREYCSVVLMVIILLVGGCATAETVKNGSCSAIVSWQETAFSGLAEDILMGCPITAGPCLLFEIYK